MNKLTEHLITVILVLLLTGCAPAQFVDTEVMQLGARATQIGLEKALQGAPSTHILSNGKLIFALWPVDGLWGGVCLNCSVSDPLGQWRFLTGGRGMAMTSQGASNLANHLMNNGWKSIPVGAVTQGEVLISYAAQIGVTLTGFLVLPLGVITEQFTRPQG